MEGQKPNTDQTICPGCVERDQRIAAIEGRNAEREKRLGELERLIDQVRRGGKRQAAPFSNGPAKGELKRPGRKGGDDYGAKAFRAVPLLDRIDEEHDAALPERCLRVKGAEATNWLARRRSARRWFPARSGAATAPRSA